MAFCSSKYFIIPQVWAHTLIQRNTRITPVFNILSWIDTEMNTFEASLLNLTSA